MRKIITNLSPKTPPTQIFCIYDPLLLNDMTLKWALQNSQNTVHEQGNGISHHGTPTSHILGSIQALFVWTVTVNDDLMFHIPFNII